MASRWFFLSWGDTKKGVTGHPADKDFVLAWISMGDRKIRVLGEHRGRVGNINVHLGHLKPSPLLVSYQMLPE